MKFIQEDLKLLKNESERLNNESLVSLQKRITVLKEEVKRLQLDMKIIKKYSAYELIIDIFSKIFGLNVLDSSKLKIKNILNLLQSFHVNNKFSEIKDFLSNVLSYIYKINDSENFIDNKTFLLDWAFFVFEEDDKLYFKYLKNIFINLSLNSPLKYADKYYFYQDDENNFIKNIKFSIKGLGKLLI